VKIAVFWVIVLCSLVEVYQRFGGACCLHHQDNELITLMMEAESTSETSVNFYHTTCHNNPEDSHCCSKGLFATETNLQI
jgi:hypothetical protein